jgi:hypothetical protein
VYKKITHTIVEEHFDHPLANQIKSSLERRRSRIPTNETFDELTFRSNVSNYFDNLANKLNGMIMSVDGTEDSLVNNFEAIYSDVDRLGNMTKPFYNSEFGERINLAMRSIPVLTALLVHAVKTGTDAAYSQTKMNTVLNELATSLNTFNQQYQWQPTRDLLAKLADGIIGQVKARKAKNATEITLSTNKLNEFISEFSTLFADRIIQQFPNRFTSMPTPSPTPMLRDPTIM